MTKHKIKCSRCRKSVPDKDVIEYTETIFYYWCKCYPCCMVLRREKEMPSKKVSLSVGRGEKLPVSKGAGLTAKGRAKYNRATGSNLKAPQPQGGPRKKSFCARMSGMPGPMKDEKGRPTRKAASLKRWKCS